MNFFIYSSLFLALHVSGAICTHPQEHNCSVQPQMCVWFWYVIIVEQVLDQHTTTIHTPTLYAEVCAPEDGCK
jgi:hypothetical protein